MIHLHTAALFFNETTTAAICSSAEGSSSSTRMDYSFGGPGYAGMVFACTAELPENFVVEFSVRGEGLPQNVECKLVDEAGTGVWWVVLRRLALTSQWQPLRFRKGRFVYAWGPSQTFPSKISRVEVTVTPEGGGAGWIEVKNIVLREIPLSRATLADADIKVSSGDSTAAALRGESAGEPWRSDASQEQELEICFKEPIELGGLVITWGQGTPRVFDVALEHPQQGWAVVQRVQDFRGGASYHYLPDSEARAIRLCVHQRADGPHYEISSLEIKPLSFSLSWDGFLSQYAAGKRRGLFPRYLSNEQSYWTVVGANGGPQKALINEEGLIELGYELPSIEPFVRIGGALRTWADGSQEQRLARGYLPIPTVETKFDSLALTTTVWADESTRSLCIRYELHSCASAPLSGSFFAVIRPFQATPPWQFLNNPGGFRPVRRLDLQREGGRECVRIDGGSRIFSLQESKASAVCGFWSGDIVEALHQGVVEGKASVEDVNGYCSGAFEFDFILNPGESCRFEFTCPYNGDAVVEDMDRSYRDTIEYWEGLLEKARFSIAAAPEVQDTVRSQLAYILVNRSGPAIQPGTRCYRRTWIRDGALTSSALLQSGFFEEVRDFIRWFAPYLDASGKVPCVVDRFGADPTPEHDSHGEFIYLVAEYYRYSGDAGLVCELMPQILRIVRCIKSLSMETMQPELPEHVRGLLPKSISHEGYSSCPAFSYWDDLWGVKGLEGAVCLAREFGTVAEAEEAEEIRREFTERLIGSIELSMKVHGISYIPGAADFGDFDATSTTIGADPCTLLLTRFRPALEQTFDKYWELFCQRASNFTGSDKYTPYEVRAMGTLARLGQEERARAALDYFMSHRRPAGWRHWAEVVWANPREPGFIGDAPHGWVGSDFLRAIRSFVLYECEDVYLVGQGVSLDWWKAGVSCVLFTPAGQFRIESGVREGEVFIELECAAPVRCTLKIPAGAVGIAGCATVDGHAEVSLPLRSVFLR